MPARGSVPGTVVPSSTFFLTSRFSIAPDLLVAAPARACADEASTICTHSLLHMRCELIHEEDSLGVVKIEVGSSRGFRARSGEHVQDHMRERVGYLEWIRKTEPNSSPVRKRESVPARGVRCRREKQILGARVGQGILPGRRTPRGQLLVAGIALAHIPVGFLEEQRFSN